MDQCNERDHDVPISTIQSLIQIYGIPKYVKPDVGGYELQVIHGLASKIDLISFEYHLAEQDYASKLEMIKCLEGFGSLGFDLLSHGVECLF